MKRDNDKQVMEKDIYDDVIASKLEESSKLPLSADNLEEGNYILAPENDEDYLRAVERYDSKNAYLRESPQFLEIDSDTFLRLVFCRGDDYERLPFEEEWCEAYEWWVAEQEEEPQNEKRPAKYDYVYNGIAQAIYGSKQKDKNKAYVITSQAERLHKILSNPFVIMSPISYTGKRRTKSNARYLYAIAIDIDEVDGENVDNLIFQSDPLRPHITFPQPQIIVNSGGGIHIYFLLEKPAAMFNDAYSILNKIKKELTRRVWNKGTTHMNPDKPQYQGNCQGFRFPGTHTKTGMKVTAFHNINKHVKPYYTISDLTFGGGGFLTSEEEQLLQKSTYDPKRVSIARARELYPEWYERRIVQKITPRRWYVNRGLYDWWKEKMKTHASVGHRYFCMMTLAIFAKKCRQLTYEEFKAYYAEKLQGLSELQIRNRFKKKKGVTEEEFRKDLIYFTKLMDELSLTRKTDDRFTLDDALDAARAYKDCYCTFPMEDLRDITGIEMKKNQRRNDRRRKEHLKRIALIRDGLYTDWTIGKGRKSKSADVLKWREEHPNGTKYACAKELGISKPTVMRWWNVTAEDCQKEIERREAKVRNVTNASGDTQSLMNQIMEQMKELNVTYHGGMTLDELAKILSDPEQREKSDIEYEIDN